jgi:transcriptional regulator with XRE-family HTH domain
MTYVHMTGEELSAARKAFGLSGAEFARVFDVSERTVRGWEAGRRDRNSEPVVVPRPIVVLVRLALKHASVRRELGIPSGRGTEAPKPA